MDSRLNNININKIFITNRSNGTINLKDIGQDKTVYLLNVNNSLVNIEGKINNLYLENCDCLDITLGSVINKFDSYKCGYIHLECKSKINTIVSEQVINLDLIIHEFLDNLQVVLMGVYCATLFYTPIKKFIPVKFGMFSDRFKTTFEQNFTPVFNRV